MPLSLTANSHPSAVLSAEMWIVGAASPLYLMELPIRFLENLRQHGLFGYHGRQRVRGDRNAALLNGRESPTNSFFLASTETTGAPLC
jgi:hypothetical protein